MAQIGKNLFVLLLSLSLIAALHTSAFAMQPSDWAQAEVESALSEGLVSKKLAENYTANITREEFCDLVMRFFEKKTDIIAEQDEQSEISFADVSNPIVLKAARLGIVKGISENEFCPDKEVTRQEACTIIVRAINIALPEVDVGIHPEFRYDDVNQISLWAKESVDYAYFHSIINGIQPYVIEPKRSISREEAIVIVYRTYVKFDTFSKKSEDFTKWSWAIEPVYDGLVPDTRFSGGLAAVKKDGKYGFIDTRGKVNINFLYDRAYDFSEGMAKVVNNNKVGFINKRGELIVPFEYDEAGSFSEGYAWVKKDGMYGFIDEHGKEIINPKYEYAYSFKDNMAPVKKNGLYGYIDIHENTVIDFEFKWASSFSEGLARVGENGKYGFINKNGEIVIDLIYDYAYDFREERAVVYYRDFAGVIDPEGKMIVDFYIYTAISDYHQGLAFAQVHGAENPDYSGPRKFLTKDGAVYGGINSNIWDNFHEGLVRNYETNLREGRPKFSYRDKTGKNILPLRDKNSDTSEYDDNLAYIMPFSEGFAAIVTKHGKLGFIKNPLLSCFD